jgi:hypothetical protein
MLMESLKELENTVGKMESSMKVNGLMEWNMDQGCGKEQKEILT